MEVKTKVKSKENPPIFYNYEPTNKNLKTLCISAPDTKEIERTINEEYELETQNALTGNILDQINAKDINADLKRDLKKKLDVLSKKTEESVFELIKKKLNKSNQKTKSEDIGDITSENATGKSLNISEHGEENLGHVLYQALNRLDLLDESD